jgi:hypothetical protein
MLADQVGSVMDIGQECVLKPIPARVKRTLLSDPGFHDLIQYLLQAVLGQDPSHIQIALLAVALQLRTCELRIDE